MMTTNATSELLGLPASTASMISASTTTAGRLMSGHHDPVYSTQNHTWIITDGQETFANINNIVYYSLLLPLGLLGNLFTLSAVIMVLRIKKSVPNMLIGVLAAADLTSLLTCHVIALVSMTNPGYHTSDELCRFQSVMMFSYFKMGFFTKLCISVDRFIALKYPLKYRVIVTTKKIIGITVFNVVFSVGSSFLTWIVDPEYIMQLETWPMCTNDFSVFTHYKLAIVIGEGGMFLIGVVFFFVGNITVVKVMLKLSKKLKKLKAHSGSALGKLGITRLTAVTTASAGLGFTAISAIQEENGSTIHEHNNNHHNENSPADEHSDLATPLSKRALRKMNSNGSTKAADDNSSNESKAKLSKMSVGNLNPASFTEGVYNIKSSPSLSTKGGDNNLPPDKRMSLPLDLKKRAVAGNKRKSVFKRMMEASRRSMASQNNNVQHRQRKELQFAKLVMVIVTVFVILWIPFMCTIYYEHHNRIRVHPLIVDISIKLVFANACINPILYGLFNANFRKAYIFYVKMLCFYLTCRMTSRPDETSFGRRRSTYNAIFGDAERMSILSRQASCDELENNRSCQLQRKLSLTSDSIHSITHPPGRRLRKTSSNYL